MNGSFQTSREIFEHPIWKNVVEFRLFFLIYGNAVFKVEGTTLAGIHIKRGQWIRSYRNLQKDLEYIENRSVKNYSLSRIKRAVDSLIKQNRIEVEECELGTLFSVVNYETYQGFNRFKKDNLERRENAERTETEQGWNNNNNVKNLKNVKNVDVVEDQPNSFEGMPTPQDAVPTFETGADSSQKKISKSDYEKQVIDRYLKLRQATCLSPNDEVALKEIVAEKISLTTVLEGIEKAFDEYIPKHSRDKIKSLKYCVPIIFDLQYVKNSNPSSGNKSSNSYKTKNHIKKDKLPPWIEDQAKREREHPKELSNPDNDDELDELRKKRIKHLLKELGESDEEEVKNGVEK